MVVQFPCLKCNRAVAKNHKAVQCDICDKWVHIACNNLDTYTYKKLQKYKSPWYCICCLQKELPYCSIGNDVLNSFMHGSRILSPNPNLSLVLLNRVSALMRKSLKRSTINITPQQYSRMHLMNEAQENRTSTCS